MNSQEQFAKDFKPSFYPSEIYSFCRNPTASAKVRLFKKYKPFSEIKIPKKPIPTKPYQLSNVEKASIVQNLNKKFSNNSLKFNDKEVINNSLNKSADVEELSFILNSLLLTDDEHSEYETADSDEETFRNKNDKQKKINQYLIQQKYLHASRYTSTTRGNMLERGIITKINNELKYNFIKNKKTKELDFGKFKIRGIIDGLDWDKKVLVEVKSREMFDLNRNTISDKERIQVMVYMKLFECSRCLFVESGPEGNQKWTYIEWDEQKFNWIMNKLEDFTNYARNLTEFDYIDLVNQSLVPRKLPYYF